MPSTTQPAQPVHPHPQSHTTAPPPLPTHPNLYISTHTQPHTQNHKPLLVLTLTIFYLQTLKHDFAKRIERVSPSSAVTLTPSCQRRQKGELSETHHYSSRQTLRKALVQKRTIKEIRRRRYASAAVSLESSMTASCIVYPGSCILHIHLSALLFSALSCHFLLSFALFHLAQSTSRPTTPDTLYCFPAQPNHL